MVVVAGIAAALLWHSTPQNPSLQSVNGDATASSPRIPHPSPPTGYAGSESCANCHEETYNLWAKSNHGLAERAPNAELDGPAFVPAREFQHGTQTSRLRAEGTNYLVTCVGLTATKETHSVVRVIGNDPLRQFLVAFPGGRLQALEAAYDPHKNEWFNVYGSEDRQPGEWGHWTGRGMNWNNMCAGCHNTRLQKNYDETSDSYHTTMAERSVGCEACHGPLKKHNEWQNHYGHRGQKDPALPRFTKQQVVDNCGFCHARRTDLTGDFKPGDSFFDHHSLAIVDQSDRFYPDGQVRDEDYEFTAFLGSKMNSSGVVCGDCHNPHSMKTVLPGNWLCMKCHNGSVTNAPVIDPPGHGHHQVFGYDEHGKLTNTDLLIYKPKEIKETGGECVNCHMPQTVYMQRHGRHDHGFTIPDPLLTKQFGIPNACTRCHADKSVDWALETAVKWYGDKMERPSRARTQWIARARNGEAAARAPLLDLLEGKESAYWKAVAAGLLAQWVSEAKVQEALLKCLEASHPLVREQAARALEPAVQGTGAKREEPSRLGEALRKLLDDPVHSVRLSAAWALRASLPPTAKATRELQEFLGLNADQPTGQMQKGAFELATGHPERALEHYQKAVAWDTNSAPIRHELAVVLSMLGRTKDSIPQLEAACRLEPHEAEYEFKLALAWNELGSLEKAAEALEKAVKINPRHARAWFNLGLARNLLGQSEAAVEALLRAEAAAPDDAEIPYARATVLARLGRTQDARRAAQRALELNPRYAEAQQLLDQMPSN